MRKLWYSSGMQQLVFIGPAAFLYILIIGLPLLLGFYYSFTSWNGVSSTVSWVGLANYVTILTEDTRFAQSMWFTAKFTIVSLVLMNVLGFALAYLLTKPLKTRNLLRTA